MTNDHLPIIQQHHGDLDADRLVDLVRGLDALSLDFLIRRRTEWRAMEDGSSRATVSYDLLADLDAYDSQGYATGGADLLACLQRSDRENKR